MAPRCGICGKPITEDETFCAECASSITATRDDLQDGVLGVLVEQVPELWDQNRRKTMSKFCSKCGKPITQDADFCVHCGASITGKKAAGRDFQAKREKIVGRAPHNKKGRFGKVSLIAVALVVVGYLIFSNLPKSGNPVISGQPVVAQKQAYSGGAIRMFDVPSTVEGKDIVVPLETVRQRKFLAFAYNGPTGTIPLLAYVSGEGKIVTAVSMCEPCNSQRFHISGDRIVCDACGSTWKLDTLEPISGGCAKYPPDVVPNVVVGNQVRIDAQTVANWRPRV